MLERLVILLVIALSGCGLSHHIYDPGGFYYVFSVGDAEEITEWALQQTEERRIRDARIALTRIAGRGSDPTSDRSIDAQERDAAIAGLVQIYRKLVEGWPDFEPRSGSTAEATQRMLKSAHTSFAGSILRNENPRLFREAFFAIRPWAEQGGVLEHWESVKETHGLESCVTP